MTALPIFPVKYIHPEERSQTLEFLEREGYVKNAEVQWKRKDGATIWVHRTMRAVRDEKGKILYLEGLVTDITDRKKSVDQLRKALVDTIQAIASIVESRDPYTADIKGAWPILPLPLPQRWGFPWS